MAERPRLKKSNEILGSISADPARSKRAAGNMQDKDEEQSRLRQDAKGKPSDADFSEEDIELTDGPVLPSAQSLAEKLLPKKSPGKRGLGAYEPAPAKPAEPRVAEIEFEEPVSPKTASGPETVEFHAAPAPPAPAAIEFGTEDAFEATPEPPAPPVRRTAPKAMPERGGAEPVVAEYTFQSFGEPQKTEPAESVWEFAAEPSDKPRPERAKTPRAGQREEVGFEEPAAPKNAPAPETAEFQAVPEPQPAPQPEPQPRRERIIRPLRSEASSVTGPGTEPTAAPPQTEFTFETEQRQPAQPGPEMSDAERNRQEFLKRIASQFEVQFEERFEEGASRLRETPSGRDTQAVREQPPAPREPLPVPEPKPQERARPQQPVPLDDQIDGEDFLAYVQRMERERQRTDRAAGRTVAGQAQRSAVPEPPHAQEDEPVLGFIEKFEKDIRAEENQRSEDFKETLSQKFMRERERYLKELDVGDVRPDESAFVPERELASPQTPPGRRKLDFQIQPEMHMQNGEPPPSPRPKTAARPAGPVTYTRGGAARLQEPEAEPPVQATAASGKKTGEQLLLEHSLRARAPAVPKPQPAKLKFTFETPEERADKQKGKKESLLPTEKWPRRIVIVAMIAGLFAIALVVWTMASYYNLTNRIANESEPADLAPEPTVEDTLDIYNDRVFTQTAQVNNVIFKYAGTLLKNANVKEYVVIEDVEGTGRIRLEDVNVDSAISVKSSGTDTLELHNVKTPRVIINNPQTGMTVSVTGNSDVEVVELRTKSGVKQTDIGEGFAGVRGMVATSPEEGGEVDARLDGLDLRTLETSAGTAILEFVNNTRAETLSADGSLSITGDGKVASLSFGKKTGQGAGDTDERKDVVLFVKDVSITSLNVKSPASLNLNTTVDSISTEDAVTIGGGASVGSLTLNPKAGSASRLLVDIVSANVQSVYSNTQSRINVTGSSRINELTADESTYVLGNKVNHLRVNADGVIYENEPDKITVANGIKPPQSKADNPNIDYNLGTPRQSPADVTGEDFATTCGHSRESGGFLVGDGSKDAPYEVSTAMQLAHAASHLASHFLQTADIDLSTESALENNFPGIGGSGAPFEGVFDGNGYGISRLRIVSQEENVGLFGANKGLIQNVYLLTGDVSAMSDSTSIAGGIAGLNFDGGQIRSCANGANVSGNNYARVGGIAGGNYNARIHDSYNYAKILGFNTVGGIAGLNRQGGSVTGCYNAGTVDGQDEVGAVIGKNEDGTVANCYYLAETSGYGIGIGGGTATEKTSEELASPQMAADLAAGNENSLWTAAPSSSAYRYPVHSPPNQ